MEQLLPEVALVRHGPWRRRPRRAREWVQSELAGLAGIGLSTMVAIEKGAATVQFGHWLRVLEALGMEGSLADFASLKHDAEGLAALEELVPRRAGTRRNRR